MGRDRREAGKATGSLNMVSPTSMPRDLDYSVDKREALVVSEQEIIIIRAVFLER